MKSQKKTLMPRMFSHRAGKTFKKSRVNDALQKEITIKFLTVLNTVKLYHWKTMHYSTHKATDELYSKFSDNFDKFTEVLMGKLNDRIHLEKVKSIVLKDLSTEKDIEREMISFKGYLVNLDKKLTTKGDNMMSNTDLLNIRDEILSDINQFLYLLTLNR